MFRMEILVILHYDYSEMSPYSSFYCSSPGCLLGDALLCDLA
jgi:hypothetical protein